MVDATLEALEKKEAALAKRAAKLREERTALETVTPVTCPFCRETSPLNTWSFLRTFWYTSPYGCTGGDYWNYGEGMIKCPKCEKWWRLYQDRHKELDKLGEKYCHKQYTQHGDSPIVDVTGKRLGYNGWVREVKY